MIVLSKFQEGILTQLDEKRKKGKLLNIGDIRNIGVTYALAEYCKRNQYILIVWHIGLKDRLINEFNYNKIYSYGEDIRGRKESIIVDVGIDLNKAREDYHGRIIGGVVDKVGYDKYGDNIMFKQEDFYCETLKTLKLEIKSLNDNLSITREKSGDFNRYISVIKSIREILNIISNYDWKLMYSEYRLGCDTNDGKSFEQKQIAVWEQNGDGQIRNHKVWDVK